MLKVSEQLAEFNKWRRGKGKKYQQAGSMPMTTEELDIAIDKAVKFCRAVECLDMESIMHIEELAKVGRNAAMLLGSADDNVPRMSAMLVLANFRKAFAKANK